MLTTITIVKPVPLSEKIRKLSENMEARDRHAIEILLRIGSIIGVCPVGSLSRIETVRHKFFAFLLLAVSLATCTYSIYFNAKDNYIHMTKMDTFVDLLSLVFNALHGSVIIIGPLFCSATWKKLLAELQSHRHLTQWYKVVHKKENRKALVYTEMFLIHVLFIARFSWDAFVWISCHGFKIYKNYLYRMYHEYSAMIAILLMVHINLAIQNHFQLLNNALRCVVKIFYPTGEMETQLCLLQGNSLNKLNMSYELRNIQTAYRRLSKMIERFNKIFGHQILFLMGYTVTVMLASLHNSLIHNNFKETMDVMILSLSLISSLTIIVSRFSDLVRFTLNFRVSFNRLKLWQ